MILHYCNQTSQLKQITQTTQQLISFDVYDFPQFYDLLNGTVKSSEMIPSCLTSHKYINRAISGQKR